MDEELFAIFIQTLFRRMSFNEKTCLRASAILVFLTSVFGLCLSSYYLGTITDVRERTRAYAIADNSSFNPFGRKPKDTEPYDVIILTYMRSGSSFIGKLLGTRDDAFYWYEPMFTTHTRTFHSTGQLVCDYAKDDCKNVSSTSTQSVQHSLKFLLDIYKCNIKQYLDRIPTGFLGTYAVRLYRECLELKPNCSKCINWQTRRRYRISKEFCEQCPFKHCYEKWAERCNTTTHRITKVLRMATPHVQYLLENHKRLKLVQMFRDPRAVINSRNETLWYYKNNRTLTDDVKYLCKRIENDLASALKLKALFPDRVKIIQYEDFYDPNRTAEILFKFLNMKMTDYVKISILDPLTHSSSKRRNGFHPYSYRDKLEANFVLSTNKYCKTAFESLGLKAFNNTNDVKNKNLTVIVNKLPYPLE